MPAIISAENIGKCYIISHNKPREELRFNELLSEWGRSACRRLRHPLSPNTEKVDLEEFWALRGLDFRINRGDRVGIIGRNGSGKSTLLKILSRITSPSEGRINLRGRVASLLEVGTGFHPELTGRENIYLNGAILGMTQQEIRKKFDEIVDFSGVERFLDTPVKRYSSGMYVRLAFAVAAHLEPEILLIDEVLAVGDMEFQKKCLGKMQDISRGEGRTILFVSHNMNAVRSLCNRGIVLEKGRQVMDGNDNVEACIERYFGSAGHAGQCCWENDGTLSNPYFTPLSLQVLDAEKRPIGNTLYAEDPYWVEIRFKVEEANPSLYFDVQLSVGETPLFAASPRMVHEHYAVHTGENRVEFRIPPDLLNTQNYRLNLRAFLPQIGELLQRRTKNPPEIELPIELRRKYSFTPGNQESQYLQPEFQWNID